MFRSNLSSKPAKLQRVEIKVLGPLYFNLTGILAGISDILAKEKISIFAILTFDTNYIFVRIQDLSSARTTLRQAGYKFE